MITIRISSSWTRHDRKCKLAYQVYKTLVYNPDIRSSFPLDERTNTHPLLGNIQTSRTTNILAYVLSYIHAKTRMHLPSYIDLEANACKQLKPFHVLWCLNSAVWVLGNCGLMDLYDAMDNAKVLVDNRLVLKKADIFDHL